MNQSLISLILLYLVECLHSWWGMIPFLIIPDKPLPTHFLSILTSFKSNSIAIKTIKFILSFICLGRIFALNGGYNFLQVFFQLTLDPILFNAWKHISIKSTNSMSLHPNFKTSLTYFTTQLIYNNTNNKNIFYH
jgi:hypothetical protein